MAIVREIIRRARLLPKGDPDRRVVCTRAEIEQLTKQLRDRSSRFEPLFGGWKPVCVWGATLVGPNDTPWLADFGDNDPPKVKLMGEVIEENGLLCTRCEAKRQRAERDNDES